MFSFENSPQENVNLKDNSWRFYQFTVKYTMPYAYFWSVNPTSGFQTLLMTYTYIHIYMHKIQESIHQNAHCIAGCVCVLFSPLFSWMKQEVSGQKPISQQYMVVCICNSSTPSTQEGEVRWFQVSPSYRLYPHHCQKRKPIPHLPVLLLWPQTSGWLNTCVWKVSLQFAFCSCKKSLL